jgi:ribulose-phosphate 3-epimerase
LQIDGGIDENTIEAVARAGADTFVAGTAVFGNQDPTRAYKNLYALASQAK